MEKNEVVKIHIDALEKVSGGVQPEREWTWKCDICGNTYTAMAKNGYKCPRCYYHCSSCKSTCLRGLNWGIPECAVCKKPQTY